MNLWAIFLTGLFTGGLTCLAVQGGLLASTIATREEDKLKEKVSGGNAFPILAFLIAKLIVYTIFGFLLGWFGSLVQLSLTASLILQYAVIIFMVGTALNILNVHPIFRYFAIQPPRFLTRFVRRQSKSGQIFAPALLGAFTVFIPCGTTQAMMALAVASGSPIAGAAILFAFVLGTSPLFFALGYFATRLGEALHQKFLKIAAATILLLVAYNLNNTLALSGIDISGNLKDFYCATTFCSADSLQGDNGQNVVSGQATINIQASGYSPNNLSLKAGSKVTLDLVNTGGAGCIQSFTIPQLGLQKIVPLGTNAQIAFSVPNKPGTTLPFMCGMGMYRGIFHIES